MSSLFQVSTEYSFDDQFVKLCINHLCMFLNFSLNADREYLCTYHKGDLYEYNHAANILKYIVMNAVNNNITFLIV